MAIYAVDSKRQQMVATGNVTPVNEWMDTPNGRRQSDQQARDADTGMLLWEVEVLYQSVSFGKNVTVTAPVQVGADAQPSVKAFTPVEFVDLMCSANVTKGGGLRESWRAERLADDKPGRAAGQGAKPEGQAA
ncbi:hypothetical protein [Microlunatus speluncae]|uniref:hypothetical protein n=1 Tax=Microlunatus speluncae TaxID=2594267 RepID=UPI0012662D33|nr:hypothetical protein [Microlunatus speluncae]